MIEAEHAARDQRLRNDQSLPGEAGDAREHAVIARESATCQRHAREGEHSRSDSQSAAFEHDREFRRPPPASAISTGSPTRRCCGDPALGRAGRPWALIQRCGPRKPYPPRPAARHTRLRGSQGPFWGLPATAARFIASAAIVVCVTPENPFIDRYFSRGRGRPQARAPEQALDPLPLPPS